MALSRTLRKSAPTKATVRRSQLITTYGTGAILPVESESFMVTGLEHWSPRDEHRIDEPRLCRLLGVDRLYSPPGGEGASKVPMVRFPEWVSCPICHRLDKFWRLADKVNGDYVNKCRHCVTPRLVPSRFVACCPAGHIQDFPYRYWTHRGTVSADDSEHSLRIHTDPSDSSLAGITVNCTCGAVRSLEGALGSGAIGLRCGGNSPWLDKLRDECSESLVGLQRGASNVWFADVRSALTVDRNLTAAEELLERILPELEGVPDTDLAVLLGIKARQHGVDADELVAAYRRQSDKPRDFAQGSKDLRAAEYEALGRLHPDGADKTFVCVPERNSTEVGPAVGLVELVSRVTRLREVRVLSGFARVSAGPESASNPFGALSRKRAGWLPAIEVLGEGVFVRIREDALKAWEETDFAQDRIGVLTTAIHAAAPQGARGPAVSVRFLVLHTLAHTLMRELVLDTGYPASSIRERIYAEPQQSGVLLYTATADAAGSLGGLCSHGSMKNISRIMESATESAQWCSADPVCLESVSTGAGATNLAACHSCLLAPEVSCEWQNRYLDRASLVGLETTSGDGLLTGAWPANP
ncbi:DUF1998 domain-containing protein [Gordonia sp. CPCC 206044]|uniref:DrmB family protein n=1 Tax=Gordonia sp. CPCC 206044 TaxID=3140793 RepID=UPI003AF34030